MRFPRFSDLGLSEGSQAETSVRHERLRPAEHAASAWLIGGVAARAGGHPQRIVRLMAVSAFGRIDAC
ncbi:hypothetical protein THIOKS11450006 [Thiocapsa sp. KS1]|nr:hypothetical protein THIOKS11450006 [Thiocapsa sp. KS1]